MLAKCQITASLVALRQQNTSVPPASHTSKLNKLNSSSSSKAKIFFSCSLDCFKQHKLQPCEQPKTTENDGNHKELKDGSAKTNLPFSTDDTVNPLKLQELSTFRIKCSLF